MDAGSLAQMSYNGSSGLGVPGTGLASRRGGQSIKPLFIGNTKTGADTDMGAPTPRTSRSHLLASLRTAPKSATAATFPASPTTAAPPSHRLSRHEPLANQQSGAEHAYHGPKTSLPRFPQMQTYNNSAPSYMPPQQAQYTPDQILAPPEIHVDDGEQANMGPDYAELVATNMYLAAQKQRLQQQLLSVQAAQQQFQNLSIGANAASHPLHQAAYQQMLYQQQQQQQQQLLQSGVANGNVYAVVDPMTGQRTLYVDQNAAQLNNHFIDQYNNNLQQLQQLQLLQHHLQLQQHGSQQANTQQYNPQQQAAPSVAPRVQVSPPAENHSAGFRNASPLRHPESSEQAAPLSGGNAFRRGHKKVPSVAGTNASLAAGPSGGNAVGQEPPKSAGPKVTAFQAGGMQTGTYGPGQGRAGEHPVRQPRGPPNFEDLAKKPTAKFEGSKNFAARTRRSAVHNLMRAGITRRQGTTTGSSGSISPTSETAEELSAPLTDDESDSGRSGSGSLNGDEVGSSLPSSRTSTGSWGAIGSDRPGSREKVRNDDSPSITGEGEQQTDSFAAVFKSAVAGSHSGKQRRAPMLVLSNVEKRKGSGL